MSIFYYNHTADGRMKRVRKSDWPSDVFEIVSEAEFDTIRAFCERIGIPFIDGDLVALPTDYGETCRESHTV